MHSTKPTDSSHEKIREPSTARQRERIEIGVRELKREKEQTTSATAQVVPELLEISGPQHDIVDVEMAKKFLSHTLPWGQTGQEFLAGMSDHLEKLRKHYFARYEAEKNALTEPEVLEYISSEAKLRANALGGYELRRASLTALAAASNSGLLVPYESKGEYPHTDRLAKFYAFNQSGEALSLLGGTSLSAQIEIDTALADALLSDEPMVRTKESKMRNDLCSREFYSFFTTAKQRTDAYQHPDFYKNGDVDFTQVRVHDVRGLMDFYIENGVKSGILLSNKLKGNETFLLNLDFAPQVI